MMKTLIDVVLILLLTATALFLLAVMAFLVTFVGSGILHFATEGFF